MLNDLHSSERMHISFFGLRNAGKSSLVNALTGLELSVVSDVKGTTTDPVQRSMELLPLGPVVIIDTPGLDDEGELGMKRIEKARSVLRKTDIAVLVVDGALGLSNLDKDILKEFQIKEIPFLIAYNKADLGSAYNKEETSVLVSAKTGLGIEDLKNRLGDFAKARKNNKRLLSDLVPTGSTVVLVMPIDESAPKGRLIMPQQMAIRDLLDAHCLPCCCQVDGLPSILEGLKNPPALIVTDSQAFGQVNKLVPEELPLTSFSILMARYKGELETLLNGASKLSELKTGDKILISEGCVHHRQCNDIGTKKMPGWLSSFSNADLEFSFSSGGDFPDDLSQYRLIVHCGGCMLNEAEMKNRIASAGNQGVPIVNYGMAIAYMNGILDRVLKPLKD